MYRHRVPVSPCFGRIRNAVFSTSIGACTDGCRYRYVIKIAAFSFKSKKIHQGLRPSRLSETCHCPLNTKFSTDCTQGTRPLGRSIYVFSLAFLWICGSFTWIRSYLLFRCLFRIFPLISVPGGITTCLTNFKKTFWWLLRKGWLGQRKSPYLTKQKKAWAQKQIRYRQCPRFPFLTRACFLSARLASPVFRLFVIWFANLNHYLSLRNHASGQ